MAARDGVIGGQHRRNPRQHRHRPEGEPPEAMLCEWAMCFHERHYRAAASRSDKSACFFRAAFVFKGLRGRWRG
jgi:hypothetical protein